MINTPMVAWLVVVALLVSVPVGLRTLGIARPGRGVVIARWAAALSFLLPAGRLAGSLAALWLMAASWLVVRHHQLRWATIAPLLWLPAAAAWLTAARLGVRPLGFSDSVVLLTAAHFHHAGFGVSALLATVRSHRGLIVHQLGMATVAIGISGADALEPIGATLIVVALSCWTAAAWRLRRALTGWRRHALTLSAVAWAYPMLLALSWALAPFLPHLASHRLAATLPAMAAQHGTVNALAVVLLGLVALTPRPSTSTAVNDASVSTTPHITLHEWSTSC